MDYQHKEKNVPQWINALHVISSWLPDINSISGILFYTFILYVIRIVIKFYCAKPFDYYEEDKDEIPVENSIGRMQKTPIINESGLSPSGVGS